MNSIQQITELFLQGINGISNSFANAKDFLGLEKEVHTFVQNFTCQVLSLILEANDQTLMEQARSQGLKSCGLKKVSLQTPFGKLQFKRRLYRKESSQEYIFLLDKVMGLPKGRYSPLFCKMATEMATYLTYRKAAETLNLCLKSGISHMSIHQAVQEAGAEIEKQEDLKEKQMLKGEDLGGKRKVETLFIEGDGLWINLQRQNKHKEELKLIIAHEGWKKISGKRYGLKEKIACGGVLDGEKIWDNASMYLAEKYDLSDTQVIINGDGASWVEAGTEWFARSEYQLDRFHLKKWLTETLGDQPNVREEVVNGLAERNWERICKAIDEALGRARSKAKRKRIKAFKTYLGNNWDALVDYRDRGLKTPLDARGLGAIEGNIDKILAQRFKGRGMSWSSRGANHLAKLLVAKTNGNLDSIPTFEKNNSPIELKPTQRAVLKVQRQGRGDYLQVHIPALDTANRPYIEAIRALTRCVKLA